MTKRFSTELKVRFGHEDHAQLVYYPRFFDYFHQAFEDFFEAHGTSYREVLTVDQVGWPAVRAEADFKAPLRFGDRLRVTLAVIKLGERSARFSYQGLRVSDGTEVVVGATTVVCVAMHDFRPQRIPDKYRRMFEPYVVAPSTGV